MSSIYDFELTSIEGHALPLSTYKGHVLLFTNVASQCGLTPQYAGLQTLQNQYAARGFSVIGLPCNQFAGQEPGTASEISNFCKNNYQVTFPLTEKIDVNGENRHPLYTVLAGEEAAFPGDISWNFEKFLVGKDGTVRQRFSPKTAPESETLVHAIETALSE